jgi:beta-xylosidase
VAAALLGSYGAVAVTSASSGAPSGGTGPVGTRGSAAAATLLGSATGDALPGAQGPYYQPAAATPAELGSPGQYVLTGRDAPDPFMLVTGGRYYLYTSQGSALGYNVPTVTSTVVGDWGPMRDALPTLPGWAVPGFTWAPDVHRFGDAYVMYYTSVVKGTDPSDECIGDATSSSPLGPFVAVQHEFICQETQRGSIDPRTFTDLDGTTYMIWKSDDNADVNGTSLTNIYSQQLSADGLSLVGSATRIFGPDEPWQGRIVEAPDLVLADGVYWLFYSGGWFNQSGYAIGVARCTGPLGPCRDTTSQPWLASNDQGQGPGEESVFRDRWGVWLLYAPWKSDVPSPTPPRPVAMARIGFGTLGPYIAAPGAPLGSGGPS